MNALDRTGEEYYCQISDVELIKKIVRDLPPNPVCINIGAGMGTSALSMLEARHDSMVISVDINDCPYENLVMKETGFCNTERYHFVKARSQEYGQRVSLESVDFVFVDGGHEYDECYEDAVVWYDVLKPNGIMAFHDYESRIKVLATVKEAVDDVVDELSLQFIERKGTIVVYKKVSDEGRR